MIKTIEYLMNVNYYYVPFRLGNLADLVNVMSEINKSPSWNMVTPDVKFLNKYISDKIDRAGDNCQMYCFDLDMKAFFKRDNIHLYVENSGQWIGINLLGIEMILFGTSIGILVFKYASDSNDAADIEEVNSILRNAGLVQLFRKKAGERGFSFVDLSKSVVKHFKEYEIEFFFNSNVGQEKSNILTYLDIPNKDNYQQELANMSSTIEDRNDIIWGIKNDSVICLVNYEGSERKDYIERSFYLKFNEQIKVMYALILHQKMALYNMLSRVNVSLFNNEKNFDKYKNDLNNLDYNFMYRTITDESNYQNLYEKIRDCMNIEKIRKEVYKPIESLIEQRSAVSDRQLVRQANILEEIVTIMAIFGVIAAMEQVYVLTKNILGPFIDDGKILLSIQIVFVAYVAIIGIYFLYKLYLVLKKK